MSFIGGLFSHPLPDHYLSQGMKDWGAAVEEQERQKESKHQEMDIPSNNCSIEENTTTLKNCSSQKNTTPFPDCSIEKITTQLNDCSIEKNVTPMKDCSIEKNVTPMKDCSIEKNVTPMKDCNIEKNTTQLENCSINKSPTSSKQNKNTVPSNLCNNDENVTTRVPFPDPTRSTNNLFPVLQQPPPFQQSWSFHSPSLFQQPSSFQSQSPFQQPSSFQSQSPFQQPSIFQPQSPFQQSSIFQSQSPFQQSSIFQSPFQKTSPFQNQKPSLFQSSSSTPGLFDSPGLFTSPGLFPQQPSTSSKANIQLSFESNRQQQQSSLAIRRFSKTTGILAVSYDGNNNPTRFCVMTGTAYISEDVTVENWIMVVTFALSLLNITHLRVVGTHTMSRVKEHLLSFNLSQEHTWNLKYPCRHCESKTCCIMRAYLALKSYQKRFFDAFPTHDVEVGQQQQQQQQQQQ